jgi:hypothetical protein
MQNVSMNRRANVAWIVIAVLFGCAFIGYLLFKDRIIRRTYQARVALDGKEPFGPVYPSDPDSVILYRAGRNGVTCFDAFRSKELHERLLPKSGHLVAVEYDTFNDFGEVRAYNVHSIDGIILANGYHVFRPDFAGSAGVAGNSNSTNDCW